MTPTWAPNSPDFPGNPIRGAIWALAFAPSDPTCNTYAFGTFDGKLRLTTNGGLGWNDLDAGNQVPDRYISDLAFDPTDANVLYATLSSFDAVTPGAPGHLFKTTDALAAAPTWSNVSPPVDLPHNAIAIDPADPMAVLVGTDAGVWQSADGGAMWTHDGPASGMPNVAVFDLQFGGAGVVAFTHGRGAFRRLIPPTATAIVAPTSSLGPCPAQFDFRAMITAYEPGTVDYRWVRSDGAMGPIQSLVFAVPGTQVVGDTWTLGGPGFVFAGWEHVQITAPESVVSNDAAFTLACPVSVAGAKLAIGDNPDPVKRKIKFAAKDKALATAAPGAPGDPRCSGPAPAANRFYVFGTGGSGQSVALPLPCENWSAIGDPSSPKGYRYVDKEQDQGPCKVVRVKNGKGAKAVCSAKNPASPIAYDLTAGEGSVGAILVGGGAFCAQLPGTAGAVTKDDDRRFKARDPLAEATCVTP
jgi:hypothetical protein